MYTHVFDDKLISSIKTTGRSNLPSVLGSNLAPVMLKITIRTVLLSLEEYRELGLKRNQAAI